MDSQYFFFALAGLLVSLFIYYAVTRWAHDIAKRNRNQMVQIRLLAKIAEKHGVSSDEIDGIINEAQY